MRQNKKKKRLTKRMYVYLAFVTMAAVSLFAKPIRRGLSALKRRLAQTSAKKANLRRDLNLNAAASTVSPYATHKNKKAKTSHSNKVAA